MKEGWSPFPPRKGRWVVMGKLKLSDFSRRGAWRLPGKWDKVAAEAAGIIGRDAGGGKAIILTTSLCLLTLPKGAARICTQGQTVTLTFPFYRGGVKVVEGMVMAPITRKAPKDPPLSFLVHVPPAQGKLECLAPAITVLESLTPPKHLHLLLHCDSKDRLIAEVGFNHSMDFEQGRRNAYTVDRRASHGDAVIMVLPGGKVTLFGATYDHGDGDGLHHVDHLSYLARKRFEDAENFPEVVKQALMAAEGWVSMGPFVPYSDGNWNRTKEGWVKKEEVAHT